MRTKAYPEPVKKEMIRNFYMERAAKYKIGPSSEDVWNVRKEKVEDAFSAGLDGDDIPREDEGRLSGGKLVEGWKAMEGNIMKIEEERKRPNQTAS